MHVPPLALPRSGSRVGGALAALSARLPELPVYAPGIVPLVDALAAARIGATYNQYADSPVRRARLAAYLEARRSAPVLLVGEAAGYRGARVSGLPFTSERQLTGDGPCEATATIVHRVLAELRLEEAVLLWNVVPTHPGTASWSTPESRNRQSESRAVLRRIGKEGAAMEQFKQSGLECPRATA